MDLFESIVTPTRSRAFSVKRRFCPRNVPYDIRICIQIYTTRLFRFSMKPLFPFQRDIYMCASRIDNLSCGETTFGFERCFGRRTVTAERAGSTFEYIIILKAHRPMLSNNVVRNVRFCFRHLCPHGRAASYGRDNDDNDDDDDYVRYGNYPYVKHDRLNRYNRQ